MARKKDPDKELKDQRIPVMLTASELTAIDDWSFANRIRSRGEAIRRLCQMGLLQGPKLEKMKGLVEWSQGWAEEAFAAYSSEHDLNIDITDTLPHDAPKFLANAKTAAGVSSVVATMLDEMKSGADLPELPQLPEPGPLVFETDAAKILERFAAPRKITFRRLPKSE